MADKLRNPRAFIKSFLGSKDGKAALSRAPYRKRNEDGTFQNVWRNADMANAFRKAVTA